MPRETSEYCQSCQEITAHSRHRLGLRTWLALALLGAAAYVTLSWPSPYGYFALVLVYLALILRSADKRRHRDIACERCRDRALEQEKRTRPTLDGNTEIQLF